VARVHCGANWPESHCGSTAGSLNALATDYVVTENAQPLAHCDKQHRRQFRGIVILILIPVMRFWRAKEQNAMSETYAIADLHGRFDLLEMALARIAERAESPATLVTLGDYVDRGPDSCKIIERLMAGVGRDSWRLICLKGNHEDIMWQTCRRLPDVDWWLTNGGTAMLISYGQ
jgi:hypothetical protein